MNRWIAVMAMCSVLVCGGGISFLSATPYAYPVPYVARDHSLIWFKDLPSSGKIKIHTISGERVAELHIGPGENIKPWGVVNDSGEKVATGVYFFIVDGDGEITTGKLVIIR